MKKVININYCNIIFFLFFGEKFEYGDEILSCFVGLVEEVGYVVFDLGVFLFFEWLKYLLGDLFKVKCLCYFVDEIKKVVKEFVDKYKERIYDVDVIDFIYSFM